MNRRAPAGAVGTLLLGAGCVALFQVRNASSLGRLGTVVAVALLLVVGAGSVAGRPWALGVALLLGLFWLWAAVAVGVQGLVGTATMLGWLAWSLAVIGGSVVARPTDGQRSWARPMAEQQED